MQAGQHGEYGFMAFADFSVQYIVGLVELVEPRCAVDDGDSIDIIEFLFAVVDDGAQLLGGACG